MRTIKLCHGKGNGIDSACLMTAVSLVSGEEPTDTPSCVCPVIGAFIRIVNDSMNDELRSELFTPLIWELPGTVDGLFVQHERANLFEQAAKDFAKKLQVSLSDLTYPCKPTLAKYKPESKGRWAAKTIIGALHYKCERDTLYHKLFHNSPILYREVFEFCTNLIYLAIAVGDKRPVEIVKTPDQLAEMLNK